MELMLLALLMAFPDALLNRPYFPETRTERISTRCPIPVIAYRLAGGALPPGMSLTGRGDLDGTPTEAGDFSFRVEISDGCARRIESREIRVIPAPILLAEAETREFRCIQGAPPFSAGIVRVSGSASGHAYAADVLDGSWLHAAQRAGVLPSSQSAFEADAIHLRIDPGKLAAGTYTARLRLSTWQGANAPELEFRLRVDSVQSVLAPLPAKPAPEPARFPVVEPPSPSIISPPHAKPPPLALDQRTAKHPPRTRSRIQSNGRSRVLPFPKVVIPPRQPVKETLPTHAKPSAMPQPHKD